MFRCKPTLQLFRHKSTGDFTILNLALNPNYGAPTGWGPLVHIGADRMRREGAELISANLDRFHERSRARSELETMSLEETSEFYDHRDVLILWLEDDSELVVTPMRRVGPASHEGKAERTLRLPIPADVFFEQILSAFRDCNGA